MRRVHVVLVGCLAPLLMAPATAQPAAGQAQVQVPESRASARATMRTFLEAMVDAASGQTGRLADAVACLDLSDLPIAGREDAGEELAIKLKEVIDRIRFVVFDDLPDDPRGPPYIFDRDATTGIPIVVAPDERGEWRFSRETVARIDDLYRALEHLDTVPGVTAPATVLSPSMWLRSKMPLELRRFGILLEHWQWLGLLVLLLLGFIIGRLVRFILHGPVRSWLSHRELVVPNELIYRMLRPAGAIAMAVTWVMGLRWLGLPPGMHALVVVVVKFIAAMAIVWFVLRVIDVVAHVFARRAAQTVSRFDDLLVPLFRKAAKVVVTAIGIVFIADVVGISPSSLLAGVGLGGLAVALAAQDTVKNFFGSLTVLLDRPFEVGDAVNIGGNTEGIVEEVGFRSTRIRTAENSLITLPNSNLISAKVDNLGRRNFRRFRTVIQITYDTPPDKIQAFCEGLRELVRQSDLTRKDNFHVYLDNLGAHSIDILFVSFFTVTGFGPAQAARHDLLLGVITLASRLGVEFAYPTQSVIVSQGASSPGAPTTYPVLDPGAHEDALRLGRAEAARIVGRPPSDSPPQESS